MLIDSFSEGSVYYGRALAILGAVIAVAVVISLL